MASRARTKRLIANQTKPKQDGMRAFATVTPHQSFPGWGMYRLI